jgi:hypothetical protein
VTDSSRTLFRLALVIPIFILVVFVTGLSFFDKPLVLFPNEIYRKRITAYADDVTGGTSRIIDFNVLDNKIVLTYRLGNNRDLSFAGLIFDVSVLDISRHDVMEIRLDITSSVRYLFTFMAFVERKSRLSELDTLVHYNKAIRLEEDKHVYTIDLRHLATSVYAKIEREEALHDGKKSYMERPDTLLFIHIKEVVKADTPDENSKTRDKVKTLIIENISFKKSFAVYYFISAAVAGLYYCIFFMFHMNPKRKKNKSGSAQMVSPPAVRLDVETYEKADLKKIMDIVRDRVFEPDFTIHV